MWRAVVRPQAEFEPVWGIDAEYSWPRLETHVAKKPMSHYVLLPGLTPRAVALAL